MSYSCRLSGLSFVGYCTGTGYSNTERRVAYWLFPGHYVLEGLITSQFHEDNTPIEATPGSPFYNFLVANSDAVVQCAGVTGLSGLCGTAEDWIDYTFGGKFSFDNVPWNVLYLVCLVVGSRLITFIALGNLNYLSK